MAISRHVERQSVEQVLYLREELYAFLLYVKPPGERRCLPLFDERLDLSLCNPPGIADFLIDFLILLNIYKNFDIHQMVQ